MLSLGAGNHYRRDLLQWLEVTIVDGGHFRVGEHGADEMRHDRFKFMKTQKEVLFRGEFESSLSKGGMILG